MRMFVCVRTVRAYALSDIGYSIEIRDLGGNARHYITRVR